MPSGGAGASRAFTPSGGAGRTAAEHSADRESGAMLALHPNQPGHKPIAAQQMSISLLTDLEQILTSPSHSVFTPLMTFVTSLTHCVLTAAGA